MALLSPYDPACSDVQKIIIDLRDRNFLFAVNHSGGKDSQAMLIKIRELVPDEQIVIVHADLGDIEWGGVQDHIRHTIGNLPLVVCRNENKTFETMVLGRGHFPSPATRQCTSDLKRGPIEKAIRHYLKQRPEFEGRVVNCMGLRAEESSNRAKATIFKIHDRNSAAGREWYDLLPIHSMLLDDVWKTIADGGQNPHPVYASGMRRLSCKICIYSTANDVRISAELDPKHFAKMVALEKRIGRTMMMPKAGKPQPLEEYSGVKADFALYPFDTTPIAAPAQDLAPEMPAEPEEYAPQMAPG